MDGRRIGSVSLRLDAVYCAATAVLVAGFTPLLAPILEVSPIALVAVASVVAAWAAFLWFGSRRFALRPMLWTVMSANIVAAAAIGLVASVLPGFAMSLLLAAVAIEVAAFAFSQAVSLGTS